MEQRPIKSKKIISRKFIVLSITALSPFILLGLILLPTQVEYFWIKKDIARIASVSNIKPLSVNCDWGIDIGTICRASYNQLTDNEVLKMLTNNGYTIEDENNYDTIYVAARNSSSHIYVTGGGNYDNKSNFTFQYVGFPS
jgi:hypothetical protein